MCLHEPEMLDKVISAQIPDPETHERLHKLVTTHMVHKPCGAANPNAPCMKDGKCSKGYPKPFQAETCIYHSPDLPHGVLMKPTYNPWSPHVVHL